MQKFCFLFLGVVALGCVEAELDPCGASNGYACAVRVSTGLGAAQGVVIADRAVLTAAHVVSGDVTVTVRTRDGEPVGRSASTVRHPSADLAVIMFWSDLDLPVAELGERVEVGDELHGAFREDHAGAVGGDDWTNPDRIAAQWAPLTGRGDSGGGVFRGDELVAIHTNSRADDRPECGGACGLEVDLSRFRLWIERVISDI